MRGVAARRLCAVLALLAVLISAGCAAPSVTSEAGPTATGRSGLPSVSADALPEAARTTLQLIDRGGPYPYSKDGAVFGNREQLLPRQPRGYYREYTVRAPGETDRGARRIVAGGGGERYYTDDHYASFREVLIR
jgi:ribonuclease T1